MTNAPPPPPPRPLLRELVTAAAMAGIGAAISASVFLFRDEPLRVSEWSGRSMVNHELLMQLQREVERLGDAIRTHQHPREN